MRGQDAEDAETTQKAQMKTNKGFNPILLSFLRFLRCFCAFCVRLSVLVCRSPLRGLLESGHEFDVPLAARRGGIGGRAGARTAAGRPRGRRASRRDDLDRGPRCPARRQHHHHHPSGGHRAEHLGARHTKKGVAVSDIVYRVEMNAGSPNVANALAPLKVFRKAAAMGVVMPWLMRVTLLSVMLFVALFALFVEVAVAG